ncbi:MAG: T9SS type A sorting domain-containing protein, partial [Chitinophagales bacterium]|nr:T9SS type A sorting domain-containing protein [Chitinophagales bacterium]
IQMNVKDFFVGGILDALQYNSCTTDITFRRLQKFKPPIGTLINWSNTDVNNSIIQSGSFIYLGGALLINAIQINHTGNTIQLKKATCLKSSSPLNEENGPAVSVINSANGYDVLIDADADGEIMINLFDISGKRIESRNQYLLKGSNSLHIATLPRGIYILQLRGTDFNTSVKLLF